MADEKIIFEIQVDSKDVKLADKRVDELNSAIEELGDRISEARNQNKQYKKEQKELNNLYKQGRITTEQYEKSVDDINKKLSVNNRIIEESKVELSKLRGERTANIKLINSETNSLAQLEARASLLNKQITQQSKATKEGREEFAKLEKELGEVNDAINKQRKSFNDYTKNIGNYPEVAAPALLNIQQLGDGLDNVGGASGVASDGVRTLSKSFKALLANPIVAVVAALVAGLAALYSAFKQSESGSRLLSKASAGLNGVWSALVKQADKLGDAMEGSFQKGGEASESFWEKIKKNVVFRFEALLELFRSVGAGLEALWEGNTEGIEKAAERGKEAIVGLVTGTTIEGLEKLGDAFNQLKQEAIEITAAFLKLEETQRQSRKAVRFLEQDVAKLQASFDQLSESAGDDTQSLEEQRKAAIEAGKVAAQLAEQQRKLASTRLNVINAEVAANRKAGKDIEDLLDQRTQAQVAYTDAVSRAAIAQQKILIEQRKIERDLFEQNLDILIDVGDKIKTEQEKIIKDESLTLEKRKMLLNASRAALTANFAEIKKEYELYGITAEQINDVISASDAKQTNERLRALGLNEIAVNRLREIILERRQAELDFNDLQAELTEEEVSRRQEANDKIKQINDQNAIDQIENAEELRDKLIELEQERLKVLLDDETLLQEERQALELESQQRIQEIKDGFTEQQKEKEEEEREERKELVEEFFEDILSASERFADIETRLFSNLAATIAKSFDDGKISAEEAFAGINNVATSVFDSISQKRTEDLTQLEAARQRELELAQGNADAQQNINEIYDRKAADLKRKQFNADKAKALVDIAIATAVAVTKALPNIPLSVTIGALGAVQAGLVASKQPPEFAEGTNDIVSIGGSHASGNDVDVWGFSGNKKQYFGKVERGEAMPVIRKSAVNDYLISKLNGQFRPSNQKTFAGGTNDITNQNNNNINELLAAFQQIKIVTKIEDITKEAGRKNEVVSNSKF